MRTMWLALGAALVATPPVSYEIGAGPRAIAVADLDRDGRPDVAVACSGDGSVSVLLGDGRGRLRPAGPPIPAGRQPSDIDAADLDRDGDVDLVVANHETSGITVLRNDGQARFTPAPGSPFDTGARPHVHGLATGDFDGDGWTDVAVDSADTREVRVLRGGPRGLGAALAVPVGTMPYSRLGVGDVTGEAGPEVLVPGHGDDTVRILLRREGSLAESAQVIRLPGKPWMVAADDVDGDRRKDIIVVQTDALGVWLAGTAGFSPAAGSPFPIPGATEVATGDLDGDGIADLVVGTWDGDEVITLAGRPLVPRRLRACERPVGLAIADLDGDRQGEILAACATGKRLVIVKSPAASRSPAG